MQLLNASHKKWVFLSKLRCECDVGWIRSTLFALRNPPNMKKITFISVDYAQKTCPTSKVEFCEDPLKNWYNFLPIKYSKAV